MYVVNAHNNIVWAWDNVVDLFVWGKSCSDGKITSKTISAAPQLTADINTAVIQLHIKNKFNLSNFLFCFLNNLILNIF